jgi:hypothetical protein
MRLVIWTPPASPNMGRPVFLPATPIFIPVTLHVQSIHLTLRPGRHIHPEMSLYLASTLRQLTGRHYYQPPFRRHIRANAPDPKLAGAATSGCLRFEPTSGWFRRDFSGHELYGSKHEPQPIDLLASINFQWDRSSGQEICFSLGVASNAAGLTGVKSCKFCSWLASCPRVRSSLAEYR